MSDMQDPSPPAHPPEARVQTHRGFNAIWLIPLVAAVIAAFLGIRALSQRGETITITFSTAEGLTAGQTHIRHKAVDLGTVRRITLSRDMQHVIVEADMRREADKFLTANARFWVVRPRLNAGNISGLETLVSGGYIEMDPGQPGAAPRTAFTGLEEPPAVRSDEPGRAYVLKADRIGSLSSGSPVFFRDIPAGEVLGYDVHPAERAEDTFINVHVFVRAPYDTFVHEGSYFWNTSGVSVQLGAQGVRLQLESLQAVLSGGIAFDTPPPPRDGPTSPPEAKFPLFNDHDAAISAGFRNRVRLLTYFTGSVRGLAVGAPVELYGIPIGSVTDIQLEFDPTGHNSRVAVHFIVQPERVFGRGGVPNTPVLAIAREMVHSGLRVQLRSANLVTGQMLLALDFFPDDAARTGPIEKKDGVIVLPSEPGGLEGLTSSVSRILQKLQALPLADIGQHLDSTLAGLDAMTNGAGGKHGTGTLAATLKGLQELIRQANAGIAPALARMPKIAEQLQAVLDRTDRLLASTDRGYGASSQVRRDLERLMDQFSDAARSVRLLADYLDQHPEALLRGRTGAAAAP